MVFQPTYDVQHRSSILYSYWRVERLLDETFRPCPSSNAPPLLLLLSRKPPPLASAAPSSRRLAQRTTQQPPPLELVRPLPTPVKRRGAALVIVGSSAGVRRAAAMSTRLATSDAGASVQVPLPGLPGLDCWPDRIPGAETDHLSSPRTKSL